MSIVLGRKGSGGGGTGGAPSGPAGGGLTGTYPNPTIGSDAVDTAQIADDAVEAAQIADGAITAAHFAAGLMPWTELFDSTLGGATASIDTGAGGFSTSLDHLIVIAMVRTTEAATASTVTITANNDGGANYDRQYVRGTNASVAALPNLAGTSWGFIAPGANIQTGSVGSIVLWLPGYSQTTFHKSGISITGYTDDTAADNIMEMKQVRWRSTSAITRLILTAGSGNLLAGCRLTVYGVG